MRLIDCPECGRGFVHRSGKQCRYCRTWLLKEGERFTREPGERAYLWLEDRGAWSEIRERR